MQGFERADRQLLDAAALAGHLVPAGSMFAFMAAHRAEVFPDAEYADLFSPPGVGRSSLPATATAVVHLITRSAAITVHHQQKKTRSEQLRHHPQLVGLGPRTRSFCI